MGKQQAQKQLIILDSDAAQIRLIIQNNVGGNNQYLNSVKEELLKAQIVSRPELPKNVVIMHSSVIIKDLDCEEVTNYKLVYPWEADIDTNKISILAPIGTALIGYEQGDEIQWQVPGGVRRLEIVSVIQPE